MEELAEFELYLDHLCGALGHADRNEGFKDSILSNQKQPIPVLTFPLKGKGLNASPFKGEARWGMR